MKKSYYIHGKGGSAEAECHYKKIGNGYDVHGLDYKGTIPWVTKEEILWKYESLHKKYASVSIIANSMELTSL